MTKIINATDFGIIPGAETAEKLYLLMRELAGTEGEKQLNFQEGIYYIDADKLPQKSMFITNTVGDNEWKRGEEPHLNRAGILMENISDLTVEGRGARFVLRGSACNAVIRNCFNVTYPQLF